MISFLERSGGCGLAVLRTYDLLILLSVTLGDGFFFSSLLHGVLVKLMYTPPWRCGRAQIDWSFFQRHRSHLLWTGLDIFIMEKDGQEYTSDTIKYFRSFCNWHIRELFVNEPSQTSSRLTLLVDLIETLWEEATSSHDQTAILALYQTSVRTGSTYGLRLPR